MFLSKLRNPMSVTTLDTIKPEAKPRGLPGSTALHLQKITKIYPGTVALEEVNLEVCYGEVHGLIGKNGAGKSTLVGILAGLIPPTSGTIWIESKSFSHINRVQAKREGVAIVTQEPEVILDITVAENLFLGDFFSQRGFIDWPGMFRKARELLEGVGLKINVHLLAGDLSLSERQLLLIIKACIVEDSRVIILDESSASLTQKDAGILRGIVRELRAQGKAIIYISHHIDELLEVCDRLTVLRDGRTVTTRTKAELSHQSLSELIVGDGFTACGVRSEQAPAVLGEEILKVAGLTRWGSFEDISFTLHRGEILGIAGLRGSGRTEILKAIAGIDPADQGQVILRGEPRLFRKPSEALKAGVAYLPEEREAEGLVKMFSIKDNLILNSLRQFEVFGCIRRAASSRRAAEIFEDVQIQAFSLEQAVEELSGGNKQKVVIGRIMAARPEIYLLDEPTKGVDIGAKKSILSLIYERIRGNAGVIITSPGLDDLIDVCDRILVLYGGKIAASYSRQEFDEKKLFSDIQGFGC
jgi:ABC-type sugar transport system ATPase subunit